MTRLRRLAPSARLLLAAVLALCVGVWLVMPPGFMPAIENGAAAIVPCPGSDGTIDIIAGSDMTMPAMPMGSDGHHHGGMADAFHHACQYSVAVALVGLSGGPPVLPAAVLAAGTPPPASALPRYRRHATRDRPPAQGPPVPA